MVHVDIDVGEALPPRTAREPRQASGRDPMRHRRYRAKKKAEVENLRRALATAKGLLQTIGSTAVMTAHRLGACQK